jgi:hypothetical protein
MLMLSTAGNCAIILHKTLNLLGNVRVGIVRIHPLVVGLGEGWLFIDGAFLLNRFDEK